MTINLVLADDHPLVLEGIARLLESEPEFRIVRRCGNGEEVIEAVQRDRPDVLVLDLNMPKLNGMGVLRRAAEMGLELRVVLLTAEITEDVLFEAVRLGVRGLILKEMAPEQLVRCIRTVHAGGQWLERHFTSWTFDRLLAQESARQQSGKVLTRRELELVRLVSEGLRNKQIAFQLGITEGTVKIHLHRIYDKLGVTSRVELANYARRELG